MAISAAHRLAASANQGWRLHTMPACCQGQSHLLSQRFILAAIVKVFWRPSLCRVELSLQKTVAPMIEARPARAAVV